MIDFTNPLPTMAELNKVETFFINPYPLGYYYSSKRYKTTFNINDDYVLEHKNNRHFYVKELRKIRERLSSMLVEYSVDISPQKEPRGSRHKYLPSTNPVISLTSLDR